MCPSFCRLDGHREANRIAIQHVKQRDRFIFPNPRIIQCPEKKGNSPFSENSHHAGRVFESCKIEVMTFQPSMYDVSTLYVIRETFHFADVLDKFNQIRSRSLL
jgi:hypothetical protein